MPGNSPSASQRAYSFLENSPRSPRLWDSQSSLNSLNLPRLKKGSSGLLLLCSCPTPLFHAAIAPQLGRSSAIPRCQAASGGRISQGPTGDSPPPSPGHKSDRAMLLSQGDLHPGSQGPLAGRKVWERGVALLMGEALNMQNTQQHSHLGDGRLAGSTPGGTQVMGGWAVVSNAPGRPQTHYVA